MCHFHISLIKALDVFCISNFVLLVFLYYILQSSYFTHTHVYRSTSTLDLTGNNSATAGYDFENPINLAEDEGEDDCEVSGEFDRLLLQEERTILPPSHQF